MAGNPLKNVGSAPPPGDGAAASGNLNTAILEHKIDELTSKISRTEQEISRLNEIARKVDMLVQRGDGQGQGQGQGQQRREAQECQRMMHEIQNSLRNLGVSHGK